MKQYIYLFLSNFISWHKAEEWLGLGNKDHFTRLDVLKWNIADYKHF